MSENLSTKKIIIWMGSFLLVAIALAAIFKMVDSGSPSVGSGDTSIPPVTAGDWVVGTSTPKVVLVEYSDFECPACASYYLFVERLVSEYGDTMQFVYRHFPLPMHSQAKAAAHASEAAGLQGKFFEMYRQLFDNQQNWAGRKDASETFSIYASRLGLDMEKYATDVVSDEVINKVNLAYSQSVSAGLNSTPTFFLNGIKISNPRSYEEFKGLVDAAIMNNE